MAMELRHLRCFLAIVEEGSLTRAAQRLHLSQPVVSRTLAQVEAHVGVRLVDRSTHHLQLTPAGEAFAARATTALAAVEAAFDAERLRSWPLRLGHAWSALGDRTAALLRCWRERHPATELELRKVDDVGEALRQGVVDAAVLRGERLPAGLQARELRREPRLAVVPAGGSLAGRAALALADLGGEVVAVNTVSGTTTTRLWPAEIRPGRTIEVTNTDDWLAVIAAGRAVGVTTSSTAAMHPYPGVVYVPLSDAPAVPVRVVWQEPPSHPAVPDLVALAGEVLADHEGG
jgi:DNA-binding transcriptional LysR family regulator